jgi:hypothetical protein
MKTRVEHCKTNQHKYFQTKQMPYLLIKNERIKDQENVSDVFNILF